LYKFCCYIIANKINGKVYIGKTSSDTSRRWKDHTRLACDPNHKKQAIHFAMAKYGVENFDFQVSELLKNKKYAKK
jgi:group I intron endonuclease